MSLNTHVLLIHGESPAGSLQTTSSQAIWCFLGSWKVAETHIDMSWGEAGSLPGSTSLARRHMHAHIHFTEFIFCYILCFKAYIV